MKFKLTTLTVEEEMGLPQNFVDAVNRLSTLVAALPDKVRAAVAKGVADATANNSGVTVADTDAATAQVNGVSDAIEGLDFTAPAPATSPADVPATPSGETAVGSQPPTF